jgi:hypothetical protein
MNEVFALKQGLPQNTTISMYDDKPDTVERLENIWTESGFKTKYFGNRIELEELIAGLLDPGDTDEKVIPAFDVKFDTPFDVFAGTKSYRIRNPRLAGVEIVEFLTRNFHSLKAICFILMSSVEVEEEEVSLRVTRLNREGVHVSFISKHESEDVVLRKTFQLIEGQSVESIRANQFTIGDDVVDIFTHATRIYARVPRWKEDSKDELLDLDREEIRDLIASRVLEAISSLGKEMQLGAISQSPLVASSTFDYGFVLELVQNVPVRIDFIQQFLGSIRQDLLAFLDEGGVVQGSWGRLLSKDGSILFELAQLPIEPDVDWQKPDSIELL